NIITLFKHGLRVRINPLHGIKLLHFHSSNQLGERTILLRAQDPGGLVGFQKLVVLSNKVVFKKGKASESSHQDDGTSPSYDLLIGNRKPVDLESFAFVYP